MRPMSVVAVPISTSAAANEALRPILSPMYPNNTAPTGRDMNPTAKVLNEAMRATNGESVAGKNTVGNTNAAAVANSRKSYHSMLAPARASSACFKPVVSARPGLVAGGSASATGLSLIGMTIRLRVTTRVQGVRCTAQTGALLRRLAVVALPGRDRHTGQFACGKRPERQTDPALEQSRDGFPQIAAEHRLCGVCQCERAMHHDARVAITRRHAGVTGLALIGNRIEFEDGSHRMSPWFATPHVQIPIDVEILVPRDAGDQLLLTADESGDLRKRGARIEDREFPLQLLD